jgi:hypothetical protein
MAEDTTSPTIAIVSVLLLILSEALPFVRRRLGSELPVDGILFGIFVLMFYSHCISEDAAQRIEAVIQRDITGDGVVGRPMRVSSEEAKSTQDARGSGESPVYPPAQSS